MINKVIIIGNLGQDPEMRQAKSGNAICNLRVATSSRTKVDGEWTETTEWHTITCFGKTAENAGKYLAKGRKVYVEGRIQTRKWQDKEGNDRYSTEVIANELKFLGGGDREKNGTPRPQTDAAPW